MYYMRDMVWEVHEGVKVEDGVYKKIILQGNFRRGKNIFWPDGEKSGKERTLQGK